MSAEAELSEMLSVRGDAVADSTDKEEAQQFHGRNRRGAVAVAMLSMAVVGALVAWTGARADTSTTGSAQSAFLKDQPLINLDQIIAHENRSLADLAEPRKLLRDPCRCLPSSMAADCNGGTYWNYKDAGEHGSRCLKQADTDFLWCYIGDECGLPFAKETNEHKCKWKMASWFDCIESQPGRPVIIPIEKQAAQAACAFNVQGVLVSLAHAGLALEGATRPGLEPYDMAKKIMSVVTSFIGASLDIIGGINNCRLGLPPVVEQVCALDIMSIISGAIGIANTGMSIKKDCVDDSGRRQEEIVESMDDPLRVLQNATDSMAQSSRSGNVAITKCVLGAYGLALSLGNFGIRASTLAAACEGPDATNHSCAVRSIATVNAIAGMGGSLAGLLGDCHMESLPGRSCAGDIIGLVHSLVSIGLTGDAARIDCKDYSKISPETAALKASLKDGH